MPGMRDSRRVVLEWLDLGHFGLPVAGSLA